MTANVQTAPGRVVEDELIRRAKSDRDALGELFDGYYPVVFRHCLRRLFLRAAAEDTASVVFLQVARLMPQFPGQTDESFRRWVFRIATNAINAELRQSRRRAELMAAAVRAGSLGGERSGGLENVGDWPDVWRAILELDERSQAIVTLRFFEGLSHEEIGAVLEERPGTVRVALSRALARLRDRLGETNQTN